MSIEGNSQQEARRSFIKKAAYIAPAIVTLNAAVTVASYGSGTLPSQPQDGNTPGNRFGSPPPAQGNRGARGNSGGSGVGRGTGAQNGRGRGNGRP